MSSNTEDLAEGYLSECEDQVRTLEWQLSEATKAAKRLEGLYGAAMDGLNKVDAENERLRSDVVRLDHIIENGPNLVDENERLRKHLKRGQTLINEMDLRMPEQATEDADGWINSYRIPVGPWHRILGWARGGW